MLRPIDQYFVQHDEPVNSCLQALRNYLLGFRSDITEDWKYGMPFYYVKGKRFCYLWTSKHSGHPYVGFVDGKLIDHPALLQEKRARMKIYPVNPAQDLPVKELNDLMKLVMLLYGIALIGKK